MLCTPRPRRAGEVVVLGPPHDTTLRLLQQEGFLLRADLAAGAAAVVLHVEPDGLSPRLAGRLRTALGPRGRIVAVCSGTQVVAVWLTLRHAGLEPKRTVIVGHAQQQQAVVLARPAKRGGLCVELAQPAG